MSSAIMTRMFGFCDCCARTEVLTAARAASAIRLGRMILLKPILRPCDSWNSWNMRPALHDRPLIVLQSSTNRSLIAPSSSLGLLELLDNLVEVVACRILERRIFDVGLQLLQPQRLTDRQHVPVVNV